VFLSAVSQPRRDRLILQPLPLEVFSLHSRKYDRRFLGNPFGGVLMKPFSRIFRGRFQFSAER